jgi:hypothetical protein
MPAVLSTMTDVSRGQMTLQDVINNGVKSRLADVYPSYFLMYQNYSVPPALFVRLWDVDRQRRISAVVFGSWSLMLRQRKSEPRPLAYWDDDRYGWQIAVHDRKTFCRLLVDNGEWSGNILDSLPPFENTGGQDDLRAVDIEDRPRLARSNLDHFGFNPYRDKRLLAMTDDQLVAYYFEFWMANIYGKPESEWPHRKSKEKRCL